MTPGNRHLAHDELRSIHDAALNVAQSTSDALVGDLALMVMRLAMIVHVLDDESEAEHFDQGGAT